MKSLAMTLLCLASFLAAPGLAQSGLSQPALDAAVGTGKVATLAPLCGLRNQDWAFDLRRAAILDATRTGRPDDSALKQAPGSTLAVGALSFGEAEALESFAEALPSATCEPLARSPDLLRADAMVAAFRALKGVPGVGS